MKNKINLKYIKFINKIIIHEKKLLFLAIAKILLGSFAALIIPYLNKIIIDNYINNLPGVIKYIIVLIALEFIVYIVIRLLSFVENKYIINKQNELMSHLVEKYLNIDNDDLNEQCINGFNKSKVFLSEHGIPDGYNNFIKFFQNIITIIGLVFLLDLYSLIIICFILIFTIINVLIKNKYNVKIYNENRKSSPITRKLFYMFGVMWDNQFAKEIKMYNADSWFEDETDHIINDANKVYKNIFKKEGILEFINNFIYIFQLALIYILIIILAINNKISVGNFTLYISTITSFIFSLKGILWSISELFNNSLYYNDYSSFMNRKKEDNEKYIIDELDKIEFKNVSFKYNDSNENVIENLSFSISKGETLTIVGKNGVGKSTIVKLLLRFLRPNQGKIYINNYDLNDVDLNSYYDKLSCLFQNDLLFPYSLQENISPFEFDTDKAYHSSEETLFINVMKKHNINFTNSYSNKLDNNGVNFSGGEVQQLLLTRTLYKNSEMLVLDEPSSNLSQAVEDHFYDSLLKDKKSNMIIMISHRLGFCDYSDKILVLDKNGYVEYGNKEELLNLKALFYLMYTKYYDFDEEETI